MVNRQGLWLIGLSGILQQGICGVTEAEIYFISWSDRIEPCHY
jgi:hypothetical protein